MDTDDPLIPQRLLLVLLVLGLSTMFCGLSPSFASNSLIPPETIQVRITGIKDCRGVEEVRYETQTINFKEYVKGVLPNEWLSEWDLDSLRAGAVAVKMYAWATYWQQGYVWDCNWNQVYDPRIKTLRTNFAVEDTWDWVIWDNGPVLTYYDDYLNACASRGQEENCMAQWGTKEDADNGMSWQDILTKYYGGELRNSNQTPENKSILKNSWNWDCFTCQVEFQR